jgi:hypothetical protein
MAANSSSGYEWRKTLKHTRSFLGQALISGPEGIDIPLPLGREGCWTNLCGEYRVKILRDLDDDLQAHELNDFRNHLKACSDCRASLEAEQALAFYRNL